MPADGALRTAAGDVDRVARAYFDRQRGYWVGPKETARCEHGRFFSYQWTRSDLTDPSVRPTVSDFEVSDPEVDNACRKCHPVEDEDL